jgi:hypothetical protein
VKALFLFLLSSPFSSGVALDRKIPVHEKVSLTKRTDNFDNTVGKFLYLLLDIHEKGENVALYLTNHPSLMNDLMEYTSITEESMSLDVLQRRFLASCLSLDNNHCFSLQLGNKTESEKHLEKAVEEFLWATTEVFVGTVRIMEGDFVGGAGLIGDGLMNYKHAYNDLQEAKEAKEREE